MATVITIVNYDCTVIAIVNYDCVVIAIVNYDFSVIAIVNYDCTVIAIVNYDCKIFIVKASAHSCDTNSFRYLMNNLGSQPRAGSADRNSKFREWNSTSLKYHTIQRTPLKRYFVYQSHNIKLDKHL